MNNLTKKQERQARRKQVKRMWVLYAMLLVPLGFMFVFDYGPMQGVLVAFKDYKYAKGIWGSPWNNFEHFKTLFSDVLFERAFWNTLRIAVVRTFVTFPWPILFALLLNEIRSSWFKRVVQTITYLPHFMSWIVIALVVYQVLSPQVGILNGIRSYFGLDPVYYQAESKNFLPTMMLAQIWKEFGYGSVIYLASLGNVNPELYEAAEMDGAGRFQKAIHITLPGILPIVMFQFIMRFGSIMKSGFDVVFNLSNGMVMDVADTLEYLSYRYGIVGGKFGIAQAIGLFQNVIGLVLLLIVNKIAKKFSDYALW